MSDPAAPVRVGEYVLTTTASGVAIADDLAYVANGTNGLQIIDVSTPINPFVAGWFKTRGYAESVRVSGKPAFVTQNKKNVGPARGENDTRDWAGLEIIDVSDRVNPAQVGGYETRGSIQNIVLAGDLAYLANGERGLTVLQILPLLRIGQNSGIPSLQIHGESGRHYVVEYASSLSPGDTWTALPTILLTNSPQIIVDTTAAADATPRFYRARPAL